MHLLELPSLSSGPMESKSVNSRWLAFWDGVVEYALQAPNLPIFVA